MVRILPFCGKGVDDLTASGPFYSFIHEPREWGEVRKLLARIVGTYLFNRQYLIHKYWVVK